MPPLPMRRSARSAGEDTEVSRWFWGKAALVSQCGLARNLPPTGQCIAENWAVSVVLSPPEVITSGVFVSQWE